MSEIDSPFHFRLRKEVLLDGTNLRDNLTGAIYPLQDLTRKILEAMDEPLKVEELVSRMVSLCVVNRTKVERELRQMLLMGLFEDTCSTTRERLQRIRDGERLIPRVLDGSRFGCQKSGACCRGYVFGPVSKEEKARIEGLEPRKALPNLGSNPLFVEAGVSSGKPTYRLATVDETCVFLEAGSQCGLHKAFGASAKPTLCQLYPLAAVATIDGLKVYDRGECATFAVSANTGTLLEDDIQRILALVDEDIYHPMVWVHGSWRCDYGLILMLARRLDTEACSKSPLQALHAMGHVTRGFIVTLTQCPFGAGQPEGSIATTLERSSNELRPSEATVASNALTGLRTLAVLAEGLAERVSSKESFTPFFVKAASLVSEICYHHLREKSISEQMKAALVISIEDDAEQALTLSLRQQLFGRDLLLDDHLPAGLLRILFVIILTLAGARLHALDDSREKVLPKHFSSSHMIMKRTLHRPEPHRLLRANGDQVWPILDALPLLVGDLGFRRIDT